MNDPDLMEVADRAVRSPVAPPPSLGSLRAAAADRQRFARRRRYSGLMAAAAVLVVAVVLVVEAGSDESSLSVVGPGPESSASTMGANPVPGVVPEITDRSLYADPMPTSDGFVLSPAGPYVAGQEVSVTVDDPRGRWDPNGAARQCAVIDGDVEICDIRRTRYIYQKVVLRAEVLGPDGLIPCSAPGVICRVAVGFEDTFASVASAPIEITGQDPPSATLAIGAEEPLGADGTVDLRVDGIEPRPESDALIDQLPEEDRDQWLRLYPEICRFRLPTEPGYGLNPWDCGGTYAAGDLTLVPGATSSSGSIALGRVFFGAGGWQDCGANGCVLVIRRNYVAGLTSPGVMGGTDEIAATPLRFDADGRPRALPTLSIDEAGPFVPDAEVTVRGTGFPVDAEMDLGRCVPDGETNYYGAQQLMNCTYSSVWADVEVAADGSFVTSIRLRCGAADGRCLLAWIPGEGAPPYASVPFEMQE